MHVPRGEAVALLSIWWRGRWKAPCVMTLLIWRHLGGFTAYDGADVSPVVWKYMVQKLGVHSILDVECGRGISTSWFASMGLDTLCVEGSHDAMKKTMILKQRNLEKMLVEHEFSRGPWWLSRTVEAIWCVEFLEHVGRNYQQNCIPAFRKAALILTTHSRVSRHKNDNWHSMKCDV
eukprot:CAMPEP_0196825542 /NCGR_PEP_ID=MMETSP1362-20130617/93115_1 /TAXON_ID=163516 /ORGANISM="Leptocylindrus danicus, Strain CCMP1856" /LENGTH=176 /DNA_ID=CAMNT_0042205983 /DNA_START=181 /DNA_END=711 /DNA_ORIENTATION=-